MIFYTTLPKLPFIKPQFKNIAQFAPPIGFLIGIIQSLIFSYLRSINWSIFAAIPICFASGYLITGGLHLDGLMDTFDGIFAGKKRMLKAIKDSRVGSFGVQSLVFITLVQIACLIKLENQIFYVYPISLFWGRFSNLFLIEKFTYISHKKKSIGHKDYWNGFKKESLISLTFLLIFIFYNLFSVESRLILSRNLILLLIGFLVSCKIPNIIGNKIGGFNGDTCGASIVIVETIMIFIYAILL